MNVVEFNLLFQCTIIYILKTDSSIAFECYKIFNIKSKRVYQYYILFFYLV